MTIHHVSVGVRDVVKSKAFYEAVLATLGMKPVMDVELPGRGLVAAAFGASHPEFWIQIPINGLPATFGNGTHIAFGAPSREVIDAFYMAALQAGAADDGAPGLRPEYSPDYYGAFVRDFDGNKIEACLLGEYEHAH